MCEFPSWEGLGVGKRSNVTFTGNIREPFFGDGERFLLTFLLGQ